jgi:hypothetical protein
MHEEFISYTGEAPDDLAQVEPWSSGLVKKPLDFYKEKEVFEHCRELGRKLGRAGRAKFHFDVDVFFPTPIGAKHLVREMRRGKAWAIGEDPETNGIRGPGLYMPSDSGWREADTEAKVEAAADSYLSHLSDFLRWAVSGVKAGIRDETLEEPYGGIWGMPKADNLNDEGGVFDWVMAGCDPSRGEGVTSAFRHCDYIMPTAYAVGTSAGTAPKTSRAFSAAAAMTSPLQDVVYCFRPIVPENANEEYSPARRNQPVPREWFVAQLQAIRETVVGMGGEELLETIQLKFTLWEGFGWERGTWNATFDRLVREGVRNFLSALEEVFPFQVDKVLQRLLEDARDLILVASEIVEEVVEAPEPQPFPKPEPIPGPQPQPQPEAEEKGNPKAVSRPAPKPATGGLVSPKDEKQDEKQGTIFDLLDDLREIAPKDPQPE